MRAFRLSTDRRPAGATPTTPSHRAATSPPPPPTQHLCSLRRSPGTLPARPSQRRPATRLRRLHRTRHSQAPAAHSGWWRQTPTLAATSGRLTLSNVGPPAPHGPKRVDRAASPPALPRSGRRRQTFPQPTLGQAVASSHLRGSLRGCGQASRRHGASPQAPLPACGGSARLRTSALHLGPPTHACHRARAVLAPLAETPGRTSRGTHQGR